MSDVNAVAASPVAPVATEKPAKPANDMKALASKIQRYIGMNGAELDKASDTFLQDEAKHQQSAVTRMILEGGISLSYCKHYGNKEGMAKYAQRALERGLKRIPDAKYQQTGARLAWLVLQGIDVTVFASELHFKPFARRTVKLGKNGECSWAKMLDSEGAETLDSVESTVCKLQEGTFEHEGKKQRVSDCVGTMLVTCFGGQSTTETQPAIRWTFSAFKGKSKSVTRAAIVKWFKALDDSNKELVQLALESCFVPVAKPAPRSRKKELASK